MVSTDSLGTAFGIIGNVISFVLFLYPLPTFITICKKKAVEQFSPIPYLATLLNCMIWLVYGMPFVHPNRVLVLTMNGIGIFIEALYIVTFFVFAPRNLRAKIIGILTAEVIFVGAVLAGLLGGIHTHDKRTKIAGILCVFFGTAMHGPLISVMRKMIQTKSVKYMPFDLNLVSLMNFLCWTCYSALHIDLYILIPNFLGVLLIFVQVMIFDACMPRTWPTPQDEPKQNLELPEDDPTSAPDTTLSSVKVEK